MKRIIEVTLNISRKESREGAYFTKILNVLVDPEEIDQVQVAIDKAINLAKADEDVRAVWLEAAKGVGRIDIE
ncbi:MAG: hypothetical protein EHM36_00060 [Deltaproteobacteria bacterium]|nr:MAG: hypothetical protein EHM36_00060 [Deltaproteobacteria bacterium]